MGEKLELLYDIRNIGAAETLKQLQAISKEFRDIKAAKIALNNTRTKVEDPAEIAEATKKLNELIIREKELAAEMKEKQIQLKQLAIQRATELAQQRSIAAGNKALAGSYNDINRQYRDLLAQTKNGIPLSDVKGMEAAKANLLALKTQIDEFNRSLSKDGLLVAEYTSGIVQAFKRLGLGDILEEQVAQGKTALTGLDESFEQLRQELRDVQLAGGRSMDAIQREMIENRKEAERLGLQLKEIQTELKGAGNIGQQISQQLSAGFKQVTRDAATFFIGYLSFQQSLSALQKNIQLNKELSDQFVDLQRILQATDATMESVNEQIRNIDTRTSLTDLFDFALIAAKAGTAEKDIAGVVKAIDELQLVAGKELGSNVEETVESLVKLVNIFEGPGKTTEDTIRRYGNALVELANAGVASGEFLVDYAQRLAGIEGLTKIQIASVLGLATAFEEQGSSAEVAATASTQMLLKISSDIPKYAELANMTTAAFQELVRTNPAEALIALAEGVKGNTQFFDEFAALLPEVEAKGVRVASTFGIMADKGDFFRQKISLANKAINDSAAITEGAERKQRNFAAVIDKITKSFELLGSNRAVVATMTAVATALSLIIGNIGIIITVLATYATLWTVANAAMIRARATKLLINAVDTAHYALLVLQTQWTAAYTASLNLLTGATSRASAAATLLSATIAATPWGWALAIIGLTVAAISLFSSSVQASTGALKAHARELQADIEITRRAKDAVAEQTTKLDANYRSIANVNNSLTTRKSLLTDLIAQYPQFSSALQGEKIDLLKLKEAYDEVRNSILLMASAKAGAELAAEKQKEVLKVVSLLQRIETETDLQKDNGKGIIGIDKLSDEDKALLQKLYGTGSIITIGSTLRGDKGNGLSFRPEDVGILRTYLNDVIKGREEVYKAYIDVSSKKQEALTQYQLEQNEKLETDLKFKGDSGNATIGELEKLIEAIDKDNKTLKELDPKLKENLERRAKLQERLDKALGKGKSVVSRLNPEQKDQFKDIEAEYDRKLTALKTAFQEEDQTKKEFQGKQITDERTYALESFTLYENMINSKLAKLKGANAEERRIAAELRLALINERRKTFDAIYKIDLDALEAQRDLLANGSKDKLAAVEGDPLATDSQKIAAKVNFYTDLINQQEAYNDAMNKLEKAFNIQSKKNEQERIRALIELRRQLNKALIDQTEAAQDNEIKEIRTRFEQEIRDISQDIYKRSAEIANDPKNSAADKQKLFTDLQNNAAEKIYQAQIKRIDSEAAHYKFMLDNKLINQQRYNELTAKLDEERYNALVQRTNAEIALEERRRRQEEAAQQTTFNISSSLSEAYINSLQRELDRELEIEQKRLEKDKERALAKAVSKEHELEIEAEFDQKMAEQEREANKRRKEIMIKQLTMEFLLAEARAISQALTIPGAGWAEAIFAAGLVAAEYATKYAIAESQEFARGGMPGDGGEIGGRSHAQGGTPFVYRGRQYEAEYKELMIINRHSAQSQQKLSVTGTPKQIASAINTYGGGVNFAPGASVGKFEYGGMLGANLTPPVYLPSNSGSSDIALLRDSIAMNHEGMMALKNLVLNMQVTLDTRKTQDKFEANNKAKDISII